MKILHLITHDKFTAGYVNFMKLCMNGYEHTFMISTWCAGGGHAEKQLVDDHDIIYYSSGRWVAFSSRVRNLIDEVDKIIVSGIFGIEMLIWFWPKCAFNKMYLQYWGGDFYQVREAVKLSDYMQQIQRFMLVSCFNRSYGAIFLIDGEYEKYKKITGIKKSHVYVAGMPSNPLDEFDYAAHRTIKYDKPVRIVIGNSATQENCHKEILDKLAHLSNEELEIYCPLSYGDGQYGNEVISYGKDRFGEKFHPINQWMELFDYNCFLASCHVGIFNCNRQQAMGNIFTMLQTGRKVYLRTNTSMFENYSEKGFVIHDVNELDHASLEELMDFPEREKNLQVAEAWDYKKNAIEEWKRVFNEK